MHTNGSFSRTAFETALTPSQVTIAQIITGALLMGVLMFALVVFYMYEQAVPGSPGAAEIDTIRTMTFVHLFFLVVNVGVGWFLAQRIFSPQSVAAAVGTEDTAALSARLVMQQRSAMIIRLAVMEGAAFFGLVICLLGSMNGVLRVMPEYWINLLSPFLLVAYGIATFPSRERLVSWFEERFLTA